MGLYHLEGCWLTTGGSGAGDGRVLVNWMGVGVGGPRGAGHGSTVGNGDEINPRTERLNNKLQFMIYKNTSMNRV